MTAFGRLPAMPKAGKPAGLHGRQSPKAANGPKAAGQNNYEL